MSNIFWDTNLFIYLFEGHEHCERVKKIRENMLKRGDQLITSTMTIAEVQVKPRRSKKDVLGYQYRDAIRQSATVIEFNEKAADIYAAIRSENISVRSADAIQLACAAAADTHLFITNDAQLLKLTIPIDGIHFIVSLDRAPI